MNLVDKIIKNSLMLTNIVSIEAALKQAHKERSQEMLIKVIKNACSKKDLLTVLKVYYCPNYFNISHLPCKEINCNICWEEIVDYYRKE